MPRGHDHQWVTERIAVGSAVSTPIHVRAVVEDGITHVIDCRMKPEGEELFRGTSVRYLHCGTEDDRKTKPITWFRKGVAFALTSMALPRSRLLIHCKLGAARSPSMVYAVLRALGWSSVDAVVAIRKARALASVTYQEDADRAIEAWKEKRGG
jgi:hypothetical protein